MKNKILSVVIPSYNVEDYLDQTLTSFINEEVMDEIEILIVDDGSKDRTAEIGKKYEEKYPKTFKLISKENGGHGSAINTGIKNATGKYFQNVDGDDWVNTEDFVGLVKALRYCDSDYVYTNYREYDVKSKTLKDSNAFKIDSEMPFDKWYEKSKKIMAMHNSVFKTSILKENNIFLDEHCFYVDVEFILLPIPYVNTISFFDLYVYVYRLGFTTQSVSVESIKKNREQHKRVLFRIIKELGEYKKYSKISKTKLNYIEYRAAWLALFQYDIYFAFNNNDNNIKKEVLNFDKELKSLAPNIYRKSRKYKRIKFFSIFKNIAYQPCVQLIQKKLYK